MPGLKRFFPATRLDGVLSLLRLMIASHFAIAYIEGTTSYINPARYAAGGEALPFQYRALTGWLLRAGTHLPGIATIAAHASRKMADPVILTWTAIVFTATLWMLHCARRLAATIFPGRDMAAIAGLSFLLPVYIDYEAIANGYRLSYPYDIPSLALFLSCFTEILAGRRRRMLLFFALNTLSRETSLFLIAIFFAFSAIDRRGARQPGLAGCLPWAASMVAIWVAAKILLTAIYGANPVAPGMVHEGGPLYDVAVQIWFNLGCLANPLQWPGLFSAVGWLWLPVFAFWHRLPDHRLRLAIALTTPLAGVIMLFLGRATETRVWGELTPLYWLAVLSLTAQQPRQNESEP